MILSLYLRVYLQTLKLLLSAGGTLLFRKLKDEGVRSHNTVYERDRVPEFLCCCSKLKTNVLTVMLHLNSANKESGDKQIWLRGNVE